MHVSRWLLLVMAAMAGLAPAPAHADDWDMCKDEKITADQAIRAEPGYARAYNVRGLVWRKKGNLDRALADFNNAIRVDPKYHFAYSNRGLIWQEKGDFDRAIADFGEVINLDPKSDVAYMRRAMAWIKRGDSLA